MNPFTPTLFKIITLPTLLYGFYHHLTYWILLLSCLLSVLPTRPLTPSAEATEEGPRHVEGAGMEKRTPPAPQTPTSLAPLSLYLQAS